MDDQRIDMKNNINQHLNDQDIIALYCARDERAITATAEKYGNYCLTVARNILHNEEDEKECINDTWLRTWQAVPPHKPRILSAFLAKITRNLAFTRWRRNQAEKRGGGEITLVLEELEQCVPGRISVEDTIENNMLTDALNSFLADLSEEERFMFLRRYWYADSLNTIAENMGKTEGAVTKAMSRTRAKLRKYLTERGFEL